MPSPRSNVARPHLDSSEHGGTLVVVGMTLSRGARFCVRISARHKLVSGRLIQSLNHDAAMRIGGEAPRRRTHSFSRHESQGGRSGPRHLEPSSAPSRAGCEAGRSCRKISMLSAHKAGRRTIPSGIAPSRASRHRAISSLRASATIIVLRV